jgi:hypothetical protein
MAPGHSTVRSAVEFTYTGPKRRYAASWPRVMQVGLIADAEIRILDKYPAVNRLSDVPGAGGLALYCEGRRGRPRYAGQPTIS